MNIQEFDYTVNLRDAILWQYNDAGRLEILLNEKNLWYINNQTQFWEDWYNNVFNLLTANPFGLSVWSIILDQPLSVGLPPDPLDKTIFGFNEIPEINTYLNFENSNFSNYSSSVILTTEEKRLVLRLKYYKLISRGASPDTNKFLKDLFLENYGACFILDNLDMSMTYIFLFEVPTNLLYFIIHFDLLPRPEGVKIKYEIITGPIFGFGPTNQNFENGNFAKIF